jgi:hypothetical protein
VKPFLPFVLVLAAALSGCKGPCRQLSEKLCDCSANTTLRTACLTRASNADAIALPTEEDDLRCKVLVPGCDCRLIETPAGKVACGLARDMDYLPDAGAQ